MDRTLITLAIYASILTTNVNALSNLQLHCPGLTVTMAHSEVNNLPSAHVVARCRNTAEEPVNSRLDLNWCLSWAENQHAFVPKTLGNAFVDAQCYDCKTMRDVRWFPSSISRRAGPDDLLCFCKPNHQYQATEHRTGVPTRKSTFDLNRVLSVRDDGRIGCFEHTGTEF
ncbi:hypothetical protein BDV25DRAFT_135330 [Aspergillus avenaceus]|uniref:Cyanovirin-N domain-containing protein n=1 Tax=Aspergillus avenaceus TaxID=36643 RepID=A0A5N6U8Q4_ASPAV|nr:hypothetical protein BDV25DRAFT_135330 [Aspergillus avenaceus]